MYALFRDTVFNIGALAFLVSYFQVFCAGVQLADEEKKCNGAIKAARDAIKKNMI